MDWYELNKYSVAFFSRTPAWWRISRTHTHTNTQTANYIALSKLRFFWQQTHVLRIFEVIKPSFVANKRVQLESQRFACYRLHAATVWPYVLYVLYVLYVFGFATISPKNSLPVRSESRAERRLHPTIVATRMNLMPLHWPPIYNKCYWCETLYSRGTIPYVSPTQSNVCGVLTSNADNQAEWNFLRASCERLCEIRAHLMYTRYISLTRFPLIQPDEHRIERNE